MNDSGLFQWIKNSATSVVWFTNEQHNWFLGTSCFFSESKQTNYSYEPVLFLVNQNKQTNTPKWNYVTHKIVSATNLEQLEGD